MTRTDAKKLLVLASKWCSKEHHDWETVMELSEKYDCNLYEPFCDARGRNWEWFVDAGYYDMICVRLKGEMDFNSQLAFHFNAYDEANRFVDLLKVAK
jgi:hypothetical protein